MTVPIAATSEGYGCLEPDRAGTAALSFWVRPGMCRRDDDLSWPAADHRSTDAGGILRPHPPAHSTCIVPTIPASRWPGIEQ